MVILSHYSANNCISNYYVQTQTADQLAKQPNANWSAEQLAKRKLVRGPVKLTKRKLVRGPGSGFLDTANSKIYTNPKHLHS